MAKILTKNSFTSGVAPAGLSAGELAVNVVDKKIFVGNAVGGVVTLHDQQSVVTSVNGATGAITNVAKLNEVQTFTAGQTFNASIVNTVDIISNATGQGLRIGSSGLGRYGAITLGRSLTVSQNTYLRNFSGVFSIYNGIDSTGPVLFAISPTESAFYVPLQGLTFYTDTNSLNISKSTFDVNDSASINIVGTNSSGTQYYSNIQGNTFVTSGTTHILPATSGTLLNTSSSYVSSVNGITGAITNVAKTNVAQTFTQLQDFSAGISASYLETSTNGLVITDFLQGKSNDDISVIGTTDAFSGLYTKGTQFEEITTVWAGSNYDSDTISSAKINLTNSDTNNKTQINLKIINYDGINDIGVTAASIVLSNPYAQDNLVNGKIELYSTDTTTIESANGSINLTSYTGGINLTQNSSGNIVLQQNSTGEIQLNGIGGPIKIFNIATSASDHGKILIGDVVGNSDGLFVAINDSPYQEAFYVKTWLSGVTMLSIRQDTASSSYPTGLPEEIYLNSNAGNIKFYGAGLIVNSGATFTGNIYAPNIVTSVNGQTGAVTIAAGSGGATGPTGSIQYNNGSGGFSGSSKLYFNSIFDAVEITTPRMLLGDYNDIGSGQNLHIDLNYDENGYFKIYDNNSLSYPFIVSSAFNTGSSRGAVAIDGNINVTNGNILLNTSERFIQFPNGTTQSTAFSANIGYTFTKLQTFAGGISASGGITFNANISAPNIVNSVNGITGPVGIAAGSNISISSSGKTLTISGNTASVMTIGSSNVNATRYLTFVGGSGATALSIDDVTTPLTYNPQGGNIGAKKVTLTTSTNIITLDSASPNVLLTDGSNSSAFGLDSFAASYAGPFTISNSNGLTLFADSGIAMEGTAYSYVFPQSNGSNGQVLTTNGAGILSWSTVTGSGSATGFTYASSAPGSPSIGDRWIDSDTGKEYVYINDGSSSQWIEPVSSNGLVGVTYTPSIRLLEFGVTGSFVKLGVNNTSPQYTLDVNGIINTPVGISASGATFSGAVVSDGGYRITSSAINAQSGTTYTLLTTDNGKIITMNNGSAITLTVPTGLPIGFNTTVIQLGSGQVGITASSTTLNSFEGKFKLAGQHAAASIISYTTNVFNVAGGLTA